MIISVGKDYYKQKFVKIGEDKYIHLIKKHWYDRWGCVSRKIVNDTLKYEIATFTKDEIDNIKMYDTFYTVCVDPSSNDIWKYYDYILINVKLIYDENE